MIIPIKNFYTAQVIGTRTRRSQIDHGSKRIGFRARKFSARSRIYNNFVHSLKCYSQVKTRIISYTIRLET